MDEVNQPKCPLSDSDIEYAAAEVRGRLLEQGMPEEAADEVIKDLLERSIFRDAAALLIEGFAPVGVKKRLIEKGLDRETATAVVDQLFIQIAAMLALNQPAEAVEDSGSALFLRIFGGIVVVIGIGLFLGNVTGLFPTFPLAGYLTILAGAGIYGIGQKKASSES